MLIIVSHNRYWNADENCWTVAREAATEYESKCDLPIHLRATNLNGGAIMSLFDEGDVGTAWYEPGDNDAGAWTIEA